MLARAQLFFFFFVQQSCALSRQINSKTGKMLRGKSLPSRTTVFTLVLGSTEVWGLDKHAYNGLAKNLTVALSRQTGARLRDGISIRYNHEHSIPCFFYLFQNPVQKNSTVPSASQKYASQKRIRPNRHNIKPQELVTLHSISTLSQLGLRGHPYVDAKLQIPRPPARRNTFFPWRMCALCLSRLIEPAKHAVNDNGALQPCRLPLPAYHYQVSRYLPWVTLRTSLTNSTFFPHTHSRTGVRPGCLYFSRSSRHAVPTL